MPRFLVSHTRTWEIEAADDDEAYEVAEEFVHGSLRGDADYVAVEQLTR